MKGQIVPKIVIENVQKFPEIVPKVVPEIVPKLHTNTAAQEQEKTENSTRKRIVPEMKNKE